MINNIDWEFSTFTRSFSRKGIYFLSFFYSHNCTSSNIFMRLLGIFVKDVYKSDLEGLYRIAIFILVRKLLTSTVIVVDSIMVFSHVK